MVIIERRIEMGIHSNKIVDIDKNTVDIVKSTSSEYDNDVFFIYSLNKEMKSIEEPVIIMKLEQLKEFSKEIEKMIAIYEGKITFDNGKKFIIYHNEIFDDIDDDFIKHHEELFGTRQHFTINEKDTGGRSITFHEDGKKDFVVDAEIVEIINAQGFQIDDLKKQIHAVKEELKQQISASSKLIKMFYEHEEK